MFVLRSIPKILVFVGVVFQLGHAWAMPVTGSVTDWNVVGGVGPAGFQLAELDAIALDGTFFELGLRVSGTDGEFITPVGDLYTVTTESAASDPLLADWNIDLSVIQAAGRTVLSINIITLTIEVLSGGTGSETTTLTDLISDRDTLDCYVVLTCLESGAVGTFNDHYQASLNLANAIPTLLPGFDFAVEALYRFTLTLDRPGVGAESVSLDVLVVDPASPPVVSIPTPSLLGLNVVVLAFGLWLYRRRYLDI